MILISNDKRERSQLIKASIVTLFFLIIGISLKLKFNNTLADYFLVVTTVFIFPVILVALDTYEKSTPKLNFLYHIIATSLMGFVLYLTSFRDITTYCEGDVTNACNWITFGTLVIYLIINAFGVGIAGYEKDKEHFKRKEVLTKTEDELEKAKSENDRLRDENELFKRKINDLDKEGNNVQIKKVTFSVLKLFEITLYKQ